MLAAHASSTDQSKSSDSKSPFAAPAITLPKGGGAIRGIGEKFAANPVTGTGSMTIPIFTSPGRSGFGPQLSLSYDSGAGNGPFGFGWSLSLPAITRKTDKGLPQYNDGAESDVFILSGAEDLVLVLSQNAQGKWERENLPIRTVNGKTYHIHRYRPRIEGLFARIECWTNTVDATDVCWHSISKDNITTWYGMTPDSRIVDPVNKSRIFSWLICQSYDDKGNAIVYGYKSEDSKRIFENATGKRLSKAHERNRTDESRSTQRYLKRIRYGNRTPYFPVLKDDAPWPESPNASVPDGSNSWHFEVVFDYGEHDTNAPTPDDEGAWTARNDPFSSYRAGFEMRTYRLCQRVLMFHHIPELALENQHKNQEGGASTTIQKGYDGLVRSTDFTYSYERESDKAREPIYSFLHSVTQTGYKHNNDGYLARSLPPVEFEYSPATVQNSIQEVDAASLENLPIGLDDATYQWADLHGEGIPGILTEQAGAWFYKRNLSPISEYPVEFASLECVGTKPNLALAGGAQLMDLAGDGQPDLVVLEGSTPGLYEHDDAEGWQTFRPFTARLQRDMRDPNLKFVDLDGDGHADVLLSEDEAFVWHTSLAEAGFGPANRVAQALDEERGPRLVFSDGTQSIYLADLSGDGMTDIVRIRNGEVCYWPNLGYGRFGAKVTMDNAPWFDAPDQFNQKRIRLADIDGSGTTDIIYLHRDGVRLYFNQSGNSWSQPQVLKIFPRVDDLVSIMPTDLLGNGTACLVWSSPLPGDAWRPMRYVNLMGGQKPHLLTKTINNLGMETSVEYAPSTKFYLQDKAAGKPWITRLSFPVHVVERVTVHDRWRGTRFSSTYSYHHGYFDGEEREFRGFGRVEQVDVEDYGTFAVGNTGSPYITDDKTLYQPPVKTVTWFHTGAFLDRERVMSQFAHEYFPNWFEDLRPGEQVLGAFRENSLPEPDLDAQDLTSEEWREALRSCKGLMLRQEVYELDADALTAGRHSPVKLFTTTYHNCHIHRVQPRADNKHAVFHVTESEVITYHYELDLRAKTVVPDPRIAHTLNLRIDEYGNIQQSVVVVYPRIEKYSDATLKDGAQELIRDVQSRLHLAYTETHYTNDVPNDPPATPPDKKDLDNYRLRLPYEVLTYELTSFQPAGGYFTLAELRSYRLSTRYQSSGAEVKQIAYHELPTATAPAKHEKRLVEHTRTLFFADTLDQPLALGQLNALALPYENYKLALTDAILKLVLADKLTSEVQAALANKKVGGHLKEASDDTTGQYWMSSGVAGFNADAKQHFYLPERFTDPFDNPTTLSYDPRDLYIQSSTDALGNRTEVVAFDFRVLAPCKLKDINDNLTEVRFDVLGMPAAMAVMGKGTEADNLDGLDDAALNPDLETLIKFFVTDDYSIATTEDSLGDASAQHIYHYGDKARKFLHKASARHVYYLGEVIRNGKIVWGQHPACACGIVRERHAAEQAGNSVQATFEYSDGGGIVRERHAAEQAGNSVQATFEYSDGAGNVLVKKIQAEPAQKGGPLRWVAGGKTILNNKGKPVKQYEPYFSDPAVGHRFEEPIEMGVTPVMYYDAPGRLIRTEAPDGSYSRVEFSPWHVTTFDQNDTVLDSAWYAERNPPNPDENLLRNGFTGGLLVTREQQAAWLAAQHADTPSVTLLDSLGREVVAITHNLRGAPGAWVDEKYVTFTRLDAEGKPLWVQDARGNRVMQYVTPPLPDGVHLFDDDTNLKSHGFAPCYDIAGNLLFQHSMDAGDRWMLNDAAGKPIFVWNSRGFITHAEYDQLHRPTALLVTGSDGKTFAAERTVYGETAFQAEGEKTAQECAKENNHLGKPYQVYDGAGVITSVSYDFKGNLTASERRLLRDYKGRVDWPTLQTPPQALPNLLGDEVFAGRTRYDALSRPIQIIAPHSAADHPQRVNTTQPTYNEAGLLERINVWLNRDTEPGDLLTGEPDQQIISNIDYNAKGQRELIRYGNGVETSYTYDPYTFRLAHLTSTRLDDSAKLQDLSYTYDPVGNITQIRDDAQDTVYHSNQCVLPGAEYRYDALYRLVAASGREHKGDGRQAGWDDSSRYVPALPNDGQALQNYVETYRYDAVGNIMQMVHHAGRDLNSPGQVRWNRRYQYTLDSNRLLATSLPGEPDGLPDYVDTPGYQATYDYDLHGNMIRMPHLPTMEWNYKDELHATARQVVNDDTPEKTYYTYDASGQRVRKVTKLANGGLKDERIYLGGFEIYRKYTNGGLRHETLHIMDDKQRVAMVETRTQGDDGSEPRLVRYQLGNHLGSTMLELTDAAVPITYEEYYPYGSTAYQAARGPNDAPKRYCYTGKERDEESGLYYHGARYYATWVGRWISSDPIGIGDGLCIYCYCHNNPSCRSDNSGTSDLGTNMEKLSLQQLEAANLLRQAKGLSPVTTLEQLPIDKSGKIQAQRKEGTVVPDEVRLPNENHPGSVVQLKGRNVQSAANASADEMAEKLAAAVKQASRDLDAVKRAKMVETEAKAQVLFIIADSPKADPKVAAALADELRQQIRSGTGKTGIAVNEALKEFPGVRSVTVTTADKIAKARDAAKASASVTLQKADLEVERVLEKQVANRLAQRRLLGKIPIIGIIFAVVLVKEDLARGDTRNAWLDALGSVPAAGEAAGIAQIGAAVGEAKAEEEERIVRGIEQFKPGHTNIFTGATEIRSAPPVPPPPPRPSWWPGVWW